MNGDKISSYNYTSNWLFRAISYSNLSFKKSG